MDKGIRNHFSIVVTNTLKYTWAILLVVVFNVMGDMDVESMEAVDLLMSLLMVAGLLALVGVIFLFQWLRWRRTYIYIEDGQLVVDQRFKINQNKTTVKLSSIASVNLTQSILQRLFGTYGLQLDINSTVTAEKTDFQLAFKQDVALALRQQLMNEARVEPSFEDRAAPAPDAAATVFMDAASMRPVIPVVSFTPGQVVRHCLLSSSLGSLVAGLVVLGSLWIGSLFDDTLVISWDIGSLIMLVIVVGPVLAQSITPFFRYYGFTASQYDNRMVVTYGLLTKQQFTLPLDKTSGILIRQTWLSRLAGLSYGEILNVGMGSEEQKQSPVFCLMMPKPQLDAVVAAVAPAFAMTEKPVPSPKAALWPILLKCGLWALPALVGTILAGVWWVGGIATAILLLIGLLSYKTKGLALSGRTMAISGGLFAKRTLILPYSRIQNMQMTCGPVSRRLNLRKGSVTLLAGALYRNQRIGYFSEEAYGTIMDRMVTHQSVESLTEPVVEDADTVTE